MKMMNQEMPDSFKRCTKCGSANFCQEKHHKEFSYPYMWLVRTCRDCWNMDRLRFKLDYVGVDKEKID